MRFYFQDSGQKVATKCIRVASDATSRAVIETLIEKFRPDMRMLSVPEYALYEIHENGGEFCIFSLFELYYIYSIGRYKKLDYRLMLSLFFFICFFFVSFFLNPT